MADCEGTPAPGCNQAPCYTCGWWAETYNLGNCVCCNVFLCAWCRNLWQRCGGEPLCGRCFPPAAHWCTWYRPAGGACIAKEPSGVGYAPRGLRASEHTIEKKAKLKQVFGSTLATMNGAILSSVSAPKKDTFAVLETFLSLGSKTLAQEIAYSTLDDATDEKSCGKAKMVLGLHDGIENEATSNEAAAIAVAGLLACGLLCACAFAQRKLSRRTRCRCILHEECPHIPQWPCARCQYELCRKCLGLEGMCCACRTCRR
jgi:hypothetical protein